MKNFFANKRIWITGASSGIGRAVAIALARQKAILAVSARNAAALRNLQASVPEARIYVLPLDVTQQADFPPVMQQIEAEMGGLDIAFLNAGAHHPMTAREFDSRIVEKLAKVNYFSLAYSIEACLPLLRRSAEPQLIGMSSIAAYAGLPEGFAYSASKAAARNLLQGLRIELLAEGIAVSVVCPGFVETPLTADNHFHMPFLMQPEAAAECILSGIANKQEEIHFPKPMSLGFKFIASLPSPLYTRLLAWVNRHKGKR